MTVVAVGHVEGSRDIARPVTFDTVATGFDADVANKSATQRTSVAASSVPAIVPRLVATALNRRSADFSAAASHLPSRLNNRHHVERRDLPVGLDDVRVAAVLWRR